MPVNALIYDCFILLCITGQLDPPEILGLLSERVLLNFTRPSALENTAPLYYYSVRLYFCSRHS